jgi:hypothetical protein
VPDGRAANQPDAATTLSPPIGAPLPGAVVSAATIFSPASSSAVTWSGDSRASAAFCSLVAAVSMRA